MPKIQWAGLPAALRDHLFDRLQTFLLAGQAAKGQQL
jgi:hypothetical protein